MTIVYYWNLELLTQGIVKMINTNDVENNGGFAASTENKFKDTAVKIIG